MRVNGFSWFRRDIWRNSENVTDCIGGARELAGEHQGLDFQTTCDPGLNAEQNLERAFQIAEMIRS